MTKRRWQTFVDAFELQKQGASPWDANALDASAAGASHGEKCIIQFLLSVWDPGREWTCGHFNLTEAIRVWPHDGVAHNAFIAWVTDPWFL